MRCIQSGDTVKPHRAPYCSDGGTKLRCSTSGRTEVSSKK